uniref:Gypsy retrotransposon integrase-like protein 1 n=1 Tax=Gasterosteus aculeatus aculeatus TaxID=481459 RepID=A0AAQ4PMW8_GASAC
MRHWSRSLNPGQQDDWNVVHQIVVPSKFRSQVLELAHDHPWSGHLGITKTYNRVLQYFFWPGLKTDVAQYCKTCHICQVNGKPNQVVPPAPLCPIPAVGEPFERVLVDCVGPLPRAKSGCQYLLTIMCVATRFPEAIPLRNITAKTVTKALTKFFTTFGLPKTVQTDQGSNFMSRVFRTSLKALGVAHVVASAYHPESQGALERWHQTLKSALRKYCTETGKEWDDGVPLVLFAVREARQDSLGFSPAELVFGHDVRGPLKMLKEEFLDRGLSAKTNVLELVSRTRERLRDACNTAKEALSLSQKKMKKRFDTKAVVRRFLPGDKVLVLFPIHGTTLSARFSGPYVIKGKQVGNGQVRPRDGKVAAVLNYPTPTTRRELRIPVGKISPLQCTGAVRPRPDSSVPAGGGRQRGWSGSCPSAGGC